MLDCLFKISMCRMTHPYLKKRDERVLQSIKRLEKNYPHRFKSIYQQYFDISN